jgi:hypothetical protein
MAGQRSQTVSVASSQEFSRQAAQQRAEAARLQREADKKWDAAQRATTSGARSNNGRQERSQALKLIAAAEENERRATAADPLALNKFGRLDFDKERAALGGAGKKKGTTTPGKAASAELDFKGAPKPTDEKQPQLENDVSQGPRFARSGTVRSQSFNINSFRSELLENDVLSTHSYLVTFSPFRAGFEENAPLTRFVTNKRNTLVLRCENVVLPTSSLLEEENIRRYGYGPVEKVPYGVQFSDVTMTWLVDKNSELIEFFNQWMNTIVMHDSPNTLMIGGLKRPGLQEYDPFEIGYKDAYTNPIVRITVYNKQNETTTTYEMYDVFPMNIQAMNLSWADENELQKLTVTFAYTNMKVRAPRARDDLPQENFVASGRIPPLMERLERLDDSGGRAAADTAGSPTNESARRTAGASTPNATSAPAPAPTTARPIPSGPATRTFVGPPPP